MEIIGIAVDHYSKCAAVLRGRICAAFAAWGKNKCACAKYCAYVSYIHVALLAAFSQLEILCARNRMALRTCGLLVVPSTHLCTRLAQYGLSKRNTR